MNLNSILIGSENPERLAKYYTKLFGKAVWEEGGYHTWQFGSGSITVIPHDQVKGKNAHPGRIIWNLETPDVLGEFERLKAAGATVVQEPYLPAGAAEEESTEMWVTTFADPDDNYFQLVSPMELPS